jgi:VanZ family protein
MTEAEPRREPRGSAVSRGALLAYMLLIVYASWFPFSGWRGSGLSPFSFLTFAMPQYWTLFDVVVNVIGYIPLGMLLVLALYPLLRGARAIVGAAILGIIVSGLMEAVQTYLPSRVPSSLDFLTNSAGALVGAFIGLAGARSYLNESRLYQTRRRWFAPHASHGLVLLALWPLAQIYPLGYMFGHGQLLPIFSEWLSSWLDTDIDLVTMLRPGAAMSAEQYWLSETVITACGMTGAVLTMLCLLNRGAPRTRLMLAMLAAALLVKTLSSSLLFTPDNAFVWITPGAQGGFLIGIIMLAGLAFAPQVAQRRLAVVTLLLSLMVVNTIPVNPYFSATLQGWVQGKFLNFNGAAQFLSLLWPFFALWFLLLPSHKRNRVGERRG